MKLLVDTSVWSLALQRRDAAGLSEEQKRLRSMLKQAIEDGQVAMLGPVRQELLSGIRERAQFDRLKVALEPFLDEVLASADYVDAARLYNECRARGVQAGTVDMLLCSVAARRGWELLSADEGMLRCWTIARPLLSMEREAVGENVPSPAIATRGRKKKGR
ncbi:MAG: PIN domain-containing protein [Acidobacteriota bacterium]|nr:PIN domain-containing protein [Acidobacteriota bacterium]